MELPSPVSDELVELIARRFRLLAEPMRIRLFDRLRDGEATVHQLADELGSSQQNASKHLTLLADTGVLARRKDGTLRLLPARRPGRARALRAGVWLGRTAPAGARRAGGGAGEGAT